MTAIIALFATDYAVLGADSRVTPGPVVAEKLWTLGGKYAVASIGSGPVGVPQAMRGYSATSGISTGDQAAGLVKWLMSHGLQGAWEFCMIGPGANGYECWVGRLATTSVAQWPASYIMPANSTDPSWPVLRNKALGPRLGISGDVQLVRDMLDVQSKAHPVYIGPPHTIAVLVK
jgi:hypothetical protein